MHTTAKQKTHISEFKAQGSELTMRYSKLRSAKGKFRSRCATARKKLGLRWFDPVPKIIGQV